MFDLLNCTYSDATDRYPVLDRTLREVNTECYESAYYSYPALGVELVVHAESGLISMVVLYRKSNVAVGLQSVSTLPKGLNFTMSRSEVEDHLGPPEVYFEGTNDPLLGKENAKSRYRIEGYFMFITYSESEASIDAVSYTPQFC